MRKIMIGSIDLKKSLKTTVFVFLLLYCLVPFETKNASLSLAIRMSVALVIVFYSVDKCSYLPKKSSYALFLFLSVAFISAITSFSLKFYVIICAFLFGISCSLAIHQNVAYRALFARSVVVVLNSSVVVIFLQLMWWKFSGNVIPFHEIVFPMSSSRTEIHDGFVRLGGLFIEPGTYSNWMYTIYLIYLFITKESIGWMGVLIAISLIATASVWGMGVGAIVLFLYITTLFSEKKYVPGIFFLSIAAVFIFYFLESSLYSFFQDKLLFETLSGTSKIDAIAQFKIIFWDILLLGNGFDSQFCMGCLSPQDVGIFINLAVVMGVVFSVAIFLLLMLFALRVGGIRLVVMIIPLGLTKIFYWDFVFWLIFFVAMTSAYGLNNKLFPVGSDIRRNRTFRLSF